MKKFEYHIKINVLFTNEESEFIYECMESHLDINRYTKKGNFAFSFVNYYAGKDVESPFSFKELDLMLKSLEVPVEKDKIDFKSKVRSKIYKYLIDINEETNKLNNNKI